MAVECQGCQKPFQEGEVVHLYPDTGVYHVEDGEVDWDYPPKYWEEGAFHLPCLVEALQKQGEESTTGGSSGS